MHYTISDFIIQICLQIEICSNQMQFGNYSKFNYMHMSVIDFQIIKNDDNFLRVYSNIQI